MSVETYDRMPTMGAAWARALASKPGLRDPAAMPRLGARVAGHNVDPGWLARYCGLTGLPTGPTLPATAPQHIAFPLHMAVLTHRAFPLRVLGVVHARQRIEQLRPLRVDERLAIGVFVAEARQARRGIEVDLVTEVDADGATLWRGVTTMLAIGAGEPSSGGDGKAAGERQRDPQREAEVPPANPEISSLLRLPADLGRRFAAVAGDRNPIHLYPWTARPFGFRKPIIHGMWSLARALASLDQRAPSEGLELTCAFRRPLALPGQARIEAWQDDGWRFAMLDSKGRVALAGHAGASTPHLN